MQGTVGDAMVVLPRVCSPRPRMWSDDRQNCHLRACWTVTRTVLPPRGHENLASSKAALTVGPIS